MQAVEAWLKREARRSDTQPALKTKEHMHHTRANVVEACGLHVVLGHCWLPHRPYEAYVTGPSRVIHECCRVHKPHLHLPRAKGAQHEHVSNIK